MQQKLKIRSKGTEYTMSTNERGIVSWSINSFAWTLNKKSLAKVKMQPTLFFNLKQTIFQHLYNWQFAPWEQFAS